jgi:hypothetical protein
MSGVNTVFFADGWLAGLRVMGIAPVFIRIHLMPLPAVLVVFAAAALRLSVLGRWGLAAVMVWRGLKMAGRDTFAYVIGTRREFYKRRGFMPASGVLHPTALPGADNPCRVESLYGCRAGASS